MIAIELSGKKCSHRNVRLQLVKRIKAKADDEARERARADRERAEADARRVRAGADRVAAEGQRRELRGACRSGRAARKRARADALAATQQTRQ